MLTRTSGVPTSSNINTLLNTYFYPFDIDINIEFYYE